MDSDLVIKILKERIKELYKMYRICQKIAMKERQKAAKDDRFIPALRYHEGQRNAYKNMVIETIWKLRDFIGRDTKDKFAIEWALK